MSAAGGAPAISLAISPTISVVITLRAGLTPAALAAAIERLSAQAGGPHEAVLVAEPSLPPAEARALMAQARALLPAALVPPQSDVGPASDDPMAARLRGLRAARGAFVTFLEPGDGGPANPSRGERWTAGHWTQGALAALARGFRAAPGVDAVQGLVRQHEPAGAAPVPEGPTAPGPGAGQRPSPPYPGERAGALLLRRTALLAALARTPERSAPESHIPEPDTPEPDTPEPDTPAPHRALFRRLAALGLSRLVIPEVVLEHPGPPGPEALEAAAPEGAATWTEAAPAPGALPAYGVILVVKEGRRYLPAALASLRRQSVAPAEILAIVGPSGDGTLDYLRAQPDVIAVAQEGRPQGSQGLAQARNQGLALARSEVIAFLDHDDLWQPRKLERQLAVLGRFAGPAACITRFRLVRDLGGEDPGVAAPVAPLPGQRPRLGWTPSALVAHRDVFRQVGAFDPATGMGCDTDWFFRLRRAAAPCGLAPEPLLDKRLHAGNLSRDNRENRAALFRVIRKNREG